MKCGVMVALLTAALVVPAGCGAAKAALKGGTEGAVAAATDTPVSPKPADQVPGSNPDGSANWYEYLIYLAALYGTGIGGKQLFGKARDYLGYGKNG